MSPKSETTGEIRRTLGTSLARARESASLHQEALARRTNYSRTSISHTEAGRQCPGRDFWEAADQACRSQGELLARYDELIDKHSESAESHPEPGDSWFSGGAAVPADEQNAMELTRRVAISDVGSETLTMLENSFNDLAVAYTTTPPSVLIVRLRRHLRYVQQLFGGRMTLAEHQRLLLVGGWFSLLGATVHIDLNQDVAATARLRTADALAREANHPGIRAWCRETEAWRLVMRNDFAGAAKLSNAAIALAPQGSSVAIQATAQAGRSYARLKRPDETYAALDSLHGMVAALPEPEVPEHHYQYDASKSLAYTATTLAWLGDPAAEGHAREVIARLDPDFDVTKWPRRVAAAKLDLALALLAADKPDEACGATLQAINSGRIVPSNHWRAAEIVRAAESRDVVAATDLREAYESLART